MNIIIIQTNCSTVQEFCVLFIVHDPAQEDRHKIHPTYYSTHLTSVYAIQVL